MFKGDYTSWRAMKSAIIGALKIQYIQTTMSLIHANNLSKFFAADEIFSGISVEVPQRARIALVGPNGAGKTTLINILAGLESPTDGSLTVAKNTRIAYLPQRPELAGKHTLWDEQLTAFNDLRAMEAKLTHLETEMTDEKHYERALAEYGTLQAEFERLGGYTYETRIKMVLTGVGFQEDEYDMSLPQLSGGQKTRALLARLLLQEPDVLILDEPTNHLDIDAVEWLENFLKDYPGAVVAVSHDRYFIDHFASTVWELEFKQLEVYRGNYSHYMRQREERRERLQKDYDAQQEFIAKEMDYIRKHMGSRWTAQAKGRLKKLETMKKRGKIIEGGPRDRKQMALDIDAGLRSGDKVLMTENLRIGYDGEVLVDVPDILLLRGEIAAIIGPNGVGKSTLLKTIIGDLQPLSGEVQQGANVKVGYFAQAHELLNSNNSILDEILSVKHMPTSEARNYLGRFLFSGDDVFRHIETLSGGERGRVALAKLALGGANLLLLDEPTNHLDIDSQEILQAVLETFGGTILLVSHDRYLIDGLATQIWSLEPRKLTVFSGSYQEYITARNRRLELTQDNPSQASDNGAKQTNIQAKKHGLNPFEVERKLAELETQIDALETQMDDLTAAIEAASTQGDAEQIRELGEQYAQTEADLQSVMAEWEKFAE